MQPPRRQRTPLVEVVAANIRKHRERLGLTQSVLAGLVQRDPRWIVRVESGRLDLRVSTIEMFAAALGVVPGALLRPATLVRRPRGRPRRVRGRSARSSG